MSRRIRIIWLGLVNCIQSWKVVGNLAGKNSQFFILLRKISTIESGGNVLYGCCCRLSSCRYDWAERYAVLVYLIWSHPEKEFQHCKSYLRLAFLWTGSWVPFDKTSTYYYSCMVIILFIVHFPFYSIWSGNRDLWLFRHRSVWIPGCILHNPEMDQTSNWW